MSDREEGEEIAVRRREEGIKFRTRLCCFLLIMSNTKITKVDTGLAEHVQKHPALYDKSLKEFKDKPMKHLIWKTIATAMKLKTGKKIILAIWGWSIFLPGTNLEHFFSVDCSFSHYLVFSAINSFY